MKERMIDIYISGQDLIDAGEYPSVGVIDRYVPRHRVNIHQCYDSVSQIQIPVSKYKYWVRVFKEYENIQGEIDQINQNQHSQE